MLKRLGSAAAITVSFSLLAAVPASAASCGLLGLICTTPAPAVPPAPVPAPIPAPAPAPAPVPAAEQPQTTSNAAPVDLAAALLVLVNQDRAQAGLVALESRGAIVAVAAAHSQAMAARGDIWHNDAYFKAATRAALGARALGENVALNGSIEDAHRRLMASPGHRANILDGRFDAVGISVVADGRGALFITENFVDSKVMAKAKAPRRAPARRATTSRRARAAARR